MTVLKKSTVCLFLMLLLTSTSSVAVTKQWFSTAGFYELAQSGRTVMSMNPGWLFYKGDIKGAEAMNFNDQAWEKVSLPHSLDVVPVDASSNANYQGVAWYRKHFRLPATLKGKRLVLYFEAVMGKCRVYVNGKLKAEHFGGYLPVEADFTDVADFSGDNVVSVCADNSDDATYPPGKPQSKLDFCYFGGIYRDCWLVSNNLNVFITDPQTSDSPQAGMTVFTQSIKDNHATLFLSLEVRNNRSMPFKGKVSYTLVDSTGRQAASLKVPLAVQPKADAISSGVLSVKNPMLWQPSDPVLYTLEVRVCDNQGRVMDGYSQRVGIRTIRFMGAQGLFLNGKRYEKPLIGTNRHQECPIVGNAMTNNMQWRDARLLKDAGVEVVRCSHYPYDPAFMDACDALGIFTIPETAGWQFWNEAPVFEEHAISDIRHLVRLERNRPSVLFFEPILNETHMPVSFMKKAAQTVAEEYKAYPEAVACDEESNGSQFYAIRYYQGVDLKNRDPKITYFKREWGDCPDNWIDQNSPSRCARRWGEAPMLTQARHYGCPPSTYSLTSLNQLYKIWPRTIGGTLWVGFDMQRGCHPEPLYNGLLDEMRRPKYSYYLFMAQRSNKKLQKPFATGPMVYIANEMTPFSSSDATVYSNCDSVRLTIDGGARVMTLKRNQENMAMPSPIMTFKNVFSFKGYLSKKKTELLAEGFVGGKVVVSDRRVPAGRVDHIRVSLDNVGQRLYADGSTVFEVVAEMVDRNGTVRRLDNHFVKFVVEGEGRLLNDAQSLTNPMPIRWGDACCLIRTTTKPGIIRVKVEVTAGKERAPRSGILVLRTLPCPIPLLYETNMLQPSVPLSSATAVDSRTYVSPAQNAAEMKDLMEVANQQYNFGQH